PLNPVTVLAPAVSAEHVQTVVALRGRFQFRIPAELHAERGVRLQIRIFGLKLYEGVLYGLVTLRFVLSLNFSIGGKRPRRNNVDSRDGHRLTNGAHPDLVYPFVQKEEERIPVRAVLFFEVGRAPHRHLFLAGPRVVAHVVPAGRCGVTPSARKDDALRFVELVLTVDHDVALYGGALALQREVLDNDVVKARFRNLYFPDKPGLLFVPY